MASKSADFPLHRSLLNRLRYKHLYLLTVLGTSQNLHRASLTLNMSQPAATRMLHEIEDMFGCHLFERLPRGMRATALGRQLVKFADATLNGLDRCAEDLELRKKGGYGYLSIGTIMGAAPDLVMNAVATIKAQNPQLRVRIMGDTSDQLLRLLDQRRIDLAIARREFVSGANPYLFEELGNERLVLVVRQGHALARRRKISMEELVEDWPWILQPQSTPTRIAFDQYLRQISLAAPADITECSSIYSMQQLVQLTDAIMLLSESTLKDYLRMGLVKALPIRLDMPMAPFGLLTHANEDLTQEQQLFIAQIRKQAQ